MTHKEYPRYVFSGAHMALVYSAEERELLPGWSDSPCADFVSPMVAQFHGVDQVPHELRIVKQDAKESSSEDTKQEDTKEEAKEEKTPEEVKQVAEDAVEEPSPVKTLKDPRNTMTVFERAELKRAKAEEYQKQRAASKAKKAAD